MYVFGGMGFDVLLRLLVCGLLFGGLSCSVFDASLLESPSASVPERPPASTSSSDDDETRVFALRNILLNQTPEVSDRIGLDIDSVQTMDLETSVCVPLLTDDETAEQTDERVRDGVAGIDNALGKILSQSFRGTDMVAGGLPCLEDNIAHLNGRGAGTLILELRGWNGERDDAQVEVIQASSSTGTSLPASDAAFRPATIDGAVVPYLAEASCAGTFPDCQAPLPDWVGDDTFYLDPQDFSGDLSAPRRRVTNAYVASGRLVVPLVPSEPIYLMAGDPNLDDLVVDGVVTISPLDGLIVADLNADGTALTLGVISGRATVAELKESSKRLGLCGVLAEMSNGAIERSADTVDVAEGPTTRLCNAVSFGLSFDAVSAAIAPELSPLPLSRDLDVCPDGVTPRLHFLCPSFDSTIVYTSPNPIPVPVPEVFQ